MTFFATATLSPFCSASSCKCTCPLTLGSHLLTVAEFSLSPTKKRLALIYTKPRDHEESSKISARSALLTIHQILVILALFFF